MLKDKAERRPNFTWVDDPLHPSYQHLVPLARPEPGPSCMKVATLYDSLRTCESQLSSHRLSQKLPGSRDSLHEQFSRRQILGGCISPSTSSRRRQSLRNLFAIQKYLDDGHSSRALSMPTTVKEKNEAKQRVTFGNIQSREYGEVLLGDNPCVVEGPAVTIGWTFSVCDPVSVDKFESTRGPRKEMNEMKLSTEEREGRLQKSGYTEKEIRKATNAIKEVKKMRQRTMANLYRDKRAEKIEGIIKEIRLVAKFNWKDDDGEEGDLWTKAQKT